VEPLPSFGSDLPVIATAARRTAFVPIWRRPWMTIGNATYGGSVLGWLGIGMVAGGSDVDYPVVELDQVGSPDLVLVPSEPYEFSDAHLDELRQGFPGARVLRVDGQDLFWWGIRTPAAIRRLAGALDVPGTVGGDDLPSLAE
jgi:hypothetical protein